MERPMMTRRRALRLAASLPFVAWSAPFAGAAAPALAPGDPLSSQRRALIDALPCYVVAPQADRGWAAYRESADGGPARVVAGFDEGARLALEIVRALAREHPIDERRIHLTGQSMGGAGVWKLLAQQPRTFAAAAVCCGSETPDDVAPARRTPLWNFHGESDQTVPVAVSRDRIARLRKAGGEPLHTEYAGVDHNVWERAYTEPAPPEWLFAQHR
jgi:predicted peptidase